MQADLGRKQDVGWRRSRKRRNDTSTRIRAEQIGLLLQLLPTSNRHHPTYPHLPLQTAILLRLHHVLRNVNPKGLRRNVMYNNRDPSHSRALIYLASTDTQNRVVDASSSLLLDLPLDLPSQAPSHAKTPTPTSIDLD